MKKLLLSLVALLTTVGAWAQITALSELNNTSAYTIQSLVRGFFFFDCSGDVTSSSAQTLTNVAPSGTDVNEKFAFLRGEKTPEGQYYLYCVEGNGFVTHNSGVDVVLTEEPLHRWTVAPANFGGNSGFTLTKSTGNEKLNITNAANGASNGCKVAETGVDGGNLMTIRVYGSAGSEDFQEALDKIAALESFGMEQNYTTDGAFWTESSIYPKGLKSNTTANDQNSNDHVGAEGHTIKKAATAVVTNGTELTVVFDYDNVSAPSCGLYILGVDIVNATGEVVASDYKLGFTGTSTVANYSLGVVPQGNYIIRYYVCHDGSNRLDATAGTITVSGAKEITEVAEVGNMLTSLKSNIGTYVTPFMGDGLGYYNTSAVTAIKTQIDATVEGTVTAQTAAFVALDDAVDALPPLVPDGTFIRIKNNGETGYLVSGTGTGLTQFEAVATAATTANSVFYYTNGKLLSFRNGMYIANGSMLTYTNTVGEAAGTTINFEVSQVAGKVQMSFMNGNDVRYFYSAGTGASDAADFNAKFTGTPEYRFTIEEVTSLPVTIGESGYATFYCPVAVTLPTGLEAYCVSSTTATSATMTKIESGVVPAETAVILKGNANDYNLTIGGEASEIDANVLEGTVASTYITKDAYVLSAPAGEAGFYMATKNQSGNTAFLNNGFKAYLPAAGGEARFLSFDFGTETAIESIEGENGNVKAEIYDLAGRRVQNAQKGLYIVNGKKVIK